MGELPERDLDLILEGTISEKEVELINFLPELRFTLKMSKQYPIEITEKRTVKRITLKQSFTDFLDAFNVERGLIYTVKLLFTKPGILVRYYLKEGRYRIVNAFRLLIITTALSLVVLSFTDSFQLLYNVNGDTKEETEEMSRFIDSLFTDWYNLILWLSIPIYALITFLLFKKYEPFNYAEHVVIQSFYISVSNLFVIVFLPFGYLIGFELAFGIAILASTIYYFFMWWDLMKLKKFRFFFRVLMAYILGNSLYLTIFGIGLVLIMLAQFSDK